MLNFFNKIILSFSVIALFTIVSNNSLKAQDIKGTEFWFSFSNATPTTETNDFGNFVYIVSDFCIDEGAYIEIPGTGFRQDFTVARGQYTEIQIPLNLGGTANYPNIPRRAQKRAVHIVTPKSVTVYLATIDAASSDAETVLPVNYLGTEYVSAIRSSPARGGVYNILVGTEDSTDVTFQSWNGGGQPFEETVRINQGETYYWFQRRPGMCDSDYPRNITAPCTTFDGSVMRSTKPIAVMGSADCSWGWDCGACDALITMPLPTSRWGNEYATMQTIPRNSPNYGPLGNPNCSRSEDVSGDYVQVMGEVGTKVYVSNKDGKDVEYTIPTPAWNNGADYGYGQIILEVSGSPAVTGGDYGFANNGISSSAPIQVIQYPKGWQTDANMAADAEAFIVPPINLWKSSYLYAILAKGSAATLRSNISIITADPNPQITIDGMAIAGFTPIANTDYQYVVVDRLLNLATNRIINATGEPFGIAMSAGAQANSFYTSGGSGDVLEVSQCPSCPLADFETDDKFYCDGEVVKITDKSKDDDPSGATQIIEWIWDYGDGSPQDTFTTSMNPTHQFPGPGSYTITLTITNNGTDPGPCTQSFTQSVRVGSGIVVDAGDDFTGCVGEKVTLGGSPTALGGIDPKTFKWTNAGDLNNGTIANPIATISGTKTYRVTVEDSIGCKVFDEVDITAIQRDSVYLGLVGTPLICTGESYSFRVIGTPGNAGPYDVTITDGGTMQTFTGVANNGTITVSPNITKNFNITAVTGAIPTKCISFSQEQLKVEVKPLPTVNIIGNNSPICEGDKVDIQINLTGTKPWDIEYSYNGNVDQLQNINSNLAFVSFTPTASGTFTITEVAYSNNPKCPVPVNVSTQVVINKRKNPGTDNTVNYCVTDGVMDLNPLLGTGVDAGQWQDADNSGALNATTGMFDPSLAGEGTFRAIYNVTGNAPCPDTSATITVTVNGTPKASNIFDTCNFDLQGYQVRFDISGGDPNSYTSPDGNITGNGAVRQFLSTQTYANKTTYNISVTDQFNCGSLILSNYVNCGCKTKAGQMSSAILQSCETSFNVVDATKNSFLLPNDTLLYVLHEGSGNTIVNPLVEQDSLIFEFDPSIMTRGKTYYVSAVAGPALNNSVDYSSDCISISQGQPLVWFRQVTGTASIQNQDICFGDPAKLDLTFNGNGPFSIKVVGKLNPEQSFNNLSSSATIDYPVTQDDSIFVFAVSDAYCSVIDTILKTAVTLHLPPAMVETQPIFTCDANLENYTMEFTITNADPNSITVVELDGKGSYDPVTGKFVSTNFVSGDPYHFQFFDQFNCGTLDVQGTYTCQCVSDAGNISTNVFSDCRTNIITVTGDAGVRDGNDVLTYALHPNPTYVEADVIQFFPDSNISFLPGLMTEETTYYVTRLAGSDRNGDNIVDLTDDCLDTSSATAQVYFFQLPSATFENPSQARVCEGSTAMLGVTVTGASPFNIETLDGFGNTTSQTVNASGDKLSFTPMDTVDVDIVKITDANGCISSIKDRANLFTIKAPKVSISTTKPNICLGDSLEIVISLDGEQPFSFDLLDDLGNGFTATNINSNEVKQFVSPNSNRTYQVVNLVDGICVGQPSNNLNVVVNSLPNAIISGAASICNGDNLFLNVKVTGGTAPYDINFDGTNGSSSSNISNDDDLPFSYTIGDNIYNIVKITDGSALQCVGQGNAANVEVHALPNGGMVGDYTVCQNDELDIDFALTGVADFVFEVEDDLGNVFGPFNSSTNNGTVKIRFDNPGIRTLSVVNVSDNFCPNMSPNGTVASVEVLDIPTIDVAAINNTGCVPIAPEITNLTDLNSVKSCTWRLNGEIVENATCDGFTQFFDKEANLDLNLELEYVSGCVRDSTFSNLIQAYPLPIPDFSFRPSNPTIVNNIVDFSNTSIGSSIAYWTIDQFKQDTGNYTSQIFPNDSIGVYEIQLIAISANNCIDSISKLLKIDGEIIFYMPNAFTPNNDGINETYGPVLNGTDEYINSYSFQIFNRWGEVIFESTTIGEMWDGIYNGVMSRPGAYSYRVLIRSTFDAERIVKQGSFILVK